MILISGSSDRAIVDLEQGDYEEMDQLAAARPYAKAAYRVNRPQDIGIGIARAIRAASSGRPGGVYLDLTAEVLGSALDVETAKKSLVKVVDPAPPSPPAPESVARALELLANAQRPLVILGKGAAYARADEEIRVVHRDDRHAVPADVDGQGPVARRPSAIGRRRPLLCDRQRRCRDAGRGAPQLAPVARPARRCGTQATRFVQVDISPTEIDSNRAIAAPVVGDIKSVFAAFNAAMKPGQIKRQAAWMDEIGKRKQQNVERMAARLNADPSPMNFSSALRAVRNALATQPDVYIVNEGANTLDFGRNIIDMDKPRHRLDSGTWGVMGIGMGYAVGAAAVTGKPVVAIEGDSAFGFSGMEIETICRYELPVTTIIFNNNGVYRGDPAGTALHADRPAARRALREDHRGVRRRRLPRAPTRRA